MLNFISDFFQQHKKIFLANTHPAVDNLKRRINNADDNNCKTIKNFLSSKNIDSECDILIIDESSTVSNRDMLEILEKVQTQSIILV
jgi:helicase, putative